MSMLDTTVLIQQKELQRQAIKDYSELSFSYSPSLAVSHNLLFPEKVWTVRTSLLVRYVATNIVTCLSLKSAYNCPKSLIRDHSA